MTGRDLIIYILQNHLEDMEILTDSNHMFFDCGRGCSEIRNGSRYNKGYD